MVWVKIDDHFDEHPKMDRVGPLGWGYWLAGLAYCNRNLTDGFIPWGVARRLGSLEVVEPDGKVWTLGRTSGMTGDDVTADWIISLLIDAGLWEEVPNGQGRIDGYRVHDFLDFNPSRQDVEEKREHDRSRKRVPRDSSEIPSGIPAESKRIPDCPVPVPAPVPIREKSSTTAVVGQPDAADAAPAPTPVRPDQEMWDAFGATIGASPSTKAERGKWNQGIKQLRDAGITVDGVPRLVSAYRTRYGDIDCNPMAIAANLTALQSPARASPNGSAKRHHGFDAASPANAVLLDRSRYGE